MTPRRQLGCWRRARSRLKGKVLPGGNNQLWHEMKGKLKVNMQNEMTSQCKKKRHNKIKISEITKAKTWELLDASLFEYQSSSESESALRLAFSSMHPLVFKIFSVLRATRRRRRTLSLSLSTVSSNSCTLLSAFFFWWALEDLVAKRLLTRICDPLDFWALDEDVFDGRDLAAT